MTTDAIKQEAHRLHGVDFVRGDMVINKKTKALDCVLKVYDKSILIQDHTYEFTLVDRALFDDLYERTDFHDPEF